MFIPRSKSLNTHVSVCKPESKAKAAGSLGGDIEVLKLPRTCLLVALTGRRW
jgi:hypothetical protein